MKKYQLLLLLFFSNIAVAQVPYSISPSVTGEYCPGVNINFSVTIAGYDPIVFSWTNNPTVVSTNFPLPNEASITTFSFTGKFRDENIAQTFGVKYKRKNKIDTTEYITFKRIKSLYYQSSNIISCPNIQPNQQSITADICKVVNNTISFPNIKWFTAGENPALCFGTITDYEYLLPSGWSIGTINSNGNNWIPGSNSVIVTSDQTSGSGSSIKIRPRNTCLNGLSNGYTPIEVYIARPEPPLSISGATQLCSPNSYSYTLSGVPNGGIVTWKPNSYYSISSLGNTATITPTSFASGSTNVTASVYLPSCGLTFSKSFPISIGIPTATFNIISYPYSEPNCYEAFGIYTFQAQQATGSSNSFSGFTWGWRNLTNNTTYNDPTTYGSQYSFFPYDPGNYEIWVKPNNSCGVGATESVKSLNVVEACFSSFSMQSTSLTVYPNPVTGKTKVVIPNEFKNTGVLHITNQFGILISTYKVPIDAKVMDLDLSKLEKGTYYLMLKSNKISLKAKLIKQ